MKIEGNQKELDAMVKRIHLLRNYRIKQMLM